MPSFDLLLTVAFYIVFFLLITVLLAYITLARGIGDIEAILCTVWLFVLISGLAQVQITLNDLAPNLYDRTLAWSEFESWSGIMWVPNGLLLLLVIGSAVTLSGRARPVC